MRTQRVISWRGLGALLALGLTAGCGQEPPRPRELPFPVIETTAPFPELAVPAASAPRPPRPKGMRRPALSKRR